MLVSNYISRHIEELAQWAKVLKVGKNDIIYFAAQKGLAPSMFSIMLSAQNITGIRWCSKIGIDDKTDLKYPFLHFEQNIDDNIQFASYINAFLNFVKELDKNEEVNFNLVFSEYSIFCKIPYIITNTGKRLDLLYDWVTPITNVLVSSTFNIDSKPVLEHLDLTNDPEIYEILSMKAADGQKVYTTPKGYVLVLWPSLLDINKGDLLFVDILEESHDYVYYVKYTVVKPKKYFKITTITKIINPSF